MIKALMKLGIEGMSLNIIKTIHDVPIANIILKAGCKNKWNTNMKKQGQTILICR
jgi:hypothetical protein